MQILLLCKIEMLTLKFEMIKEIYIIFMLATNIFKKYY